MMAEEEEEEEVEGGEKKGVRPHSEYGTATDAYVSETEEERWEIEEETAMAIG